MKGLEFVNEFISILADEGDMFFSLGSTEDDYDLIVSQIKANGGYWAGIRQRYYFDKDLNFMYTEGRVFGK